MNKKIAALLLISLFWAGCAHRVPSAKRAHGVVEHFLTKYGRKYKETSFGQHKISKVEISDVHEVQKGIAEVEAFVVLGQGDSVHKVRFLLHKKTLRWRVASWEDTGGT